MNKIADHLRQQAPQQDMLACEDMQKGADEIDKLELALYAQEDVKPLYDEIQQLRKLVKDLADDLEIEVENHYHNVKDYPSEKRRYERDMINVYRARDVLREV